MKCWNRTISSPRYAASGPTRSPPTAGPVKTTQQISAVLRGRSVTILLKWRIVRLAPKSMSMTSKLLFAFWPCAQNTTTHFNCRLIAIRSFKRVCDTFYVSAQLFGTVLIYFCGFLIGSSNQPGGDDCGDLPVDCTRHNAVYHILHYLTDAQFLVDGNQHLRYVALFLPVILPCTKTNYCLWFIFFLLSLLMEHLFVTGGPQHGPSALLL